MNLTDGRQPQHLGRDADVVPYASGVDREALRSLALL